MKEMLIEQAWVIWAFSTYLNLREMQILVYLISLVGVAIWRVTLWSNYTQTTLLVFILELMFLFLSSFNVLISYKDYRLEGGIKGQRHGANKLLRKGGNCLSFLCG